MFFSAKIIKIILAILIILSALNTHAQPGTGLPVWTVSNLSDSGLQIIDWRVSPYAIKTLNIPSPSIHCPSVPAVSACGDLVFFVRHSGMPNASHNLFIYSPDGSVLLDASTPNGPGFNAKRTGYEIQVVKVPGTLNEWYIIYPEWKSDIGAPIGNGGYITSYILYSKVRYLCNNIEVLERDIVLKVNGTSYTYSTALSVSATNDPGIFYLYANRRNENNDYLSLDRYIINNSGITWDKNTGNINSNFSIFAIDAAPLVVSNDGKRIALSNRNAGSENVDFIIFDAEDFSNAPGSLQVINAGNLILQPDNQVLFSEMTVIDAANSVPQLDYLAFMENKMTQISFSPSGRYFYFTHGGFAGSGSNDYVHTYVGQIEIGTYNNPEPYPYKLRLQVEEPPAYSSGEKVNILEEFDGTRQIQQSFSGNYYFNKWTTAFLYVVPDPDEPLLNNLIPYKVDLSDATHPNIPIKATSWHSPDQIDGYNYVTAPRPVISLGNDTSICDNNISLTPGDQYISYCWQDGSINPVYTASASGEYWVEIMDVNGCFARDTIYIELISQVITLGNDTVFCAGDSIVISPGYGYEQYLWKDGSTLPELEVNEPGTYWVEVISFEGCLIKDTIEVATLTESIELGSDLNLCDGDSIYLSAGAGYSDYIWQDGSTDSWIIVNDSGYHWVEVTAAGGCTAKDSIYVYLHDRPVVDLGPDTLIINEESFTLDAGAGFESYLWQDGSQSQFYEVTENGYYHVVVENESCSASDTVYIILSDCEAVLVAPNCFTPNSDGYNDTFKVSTKNLYDFNLIIFNRWGQQLFETHDINEGWDGKYKGNMCPVGTYFYVIYYTTFCSVGLEKTGDKAGSVTLLQ